MMDSLRQRAWRRVSLTFPERQIYIRSDGRVQFFTCSSQMQAILTGLAIVFFGWVAFTSVNVIFKDRILAAKERHFEQMQASYESRIGDLQLSYDELNSALVVAQDRFKAIADTFEAKQQVLAAVIEHKKALQASLGIGTPAANQASNPKAVGFPAFNPSGIGGAFDTLAPSSTAELAPPSAAGSGPIADRPAQSVTIPLRNPALPDPSHAPGRPTFFKGAVQTLGSLFHRKISANAPDHPILKEADAQSARIIRLELGEPALLAEATLDLNKEATRLTRALKSTGLDTKTLMNRVSSGHGQGGELIPLEPSSDALGEGFTAGIAEAATAMEKLDDVVTALNALPLAAPTEFGSVSSGYGARIDPFNEHLAFHSGIDFSGPKGEDVQVTAPGIVVFTGPRGAYGNTVEVDHGYGIRTRYGHLAKILAQVGTRVDKGDVVGKLGSTGRSTGPHVHYEVWYDDAVRDPGKFIKAGQYVLQK
jgi:murein DD-endopeptidase MepM/ murein hydrolase activator NlpD